MFSIRRQRPRASGSASFVQLFSDWRRRVTPACSAACITIGVLALGQLSTTLAASTKFHLQEATIADIQSAILSKQITTEQLVKLYLNRIKAYNSACVKRAARHPEVD